MRPQYETLGLPVSKHFVWLREDGGPGAMTAMAAVSRVLTAATLRVCQPLSPVSDGGDCNGDGDGDNDNDGNDTKKPHALKVCVPLLSQRLQFTYLHI